MIEPILENYHKKKRILLLSIVTFLVSAVWISYVVYKLEKETIYADIDAFLKSDALNVELLLPSSFFDRAVSQNTISKAEDQANILKLSHYNDNLQSAYVYTFTIQNNKVYFTSSSATRKEREEGSATKYFDEYKDATKSLRTIFEKNKIVYEEATDKWGTFRSVLIPRKTLKGTPYIIGIDIQLDTIIERIRTLQKNLLLIEVFVLLIFFYLVYQFYKLLRQEINDITLVEKALHNEIEEKTKSLQALSESLQQRVIEEVEKNRQKEKQLLVQSRFAQMGEMINMIAHQWRQPLNIINSAIIVLEVKAKRDEIDKELIQKITGDISKYVQHLSQTIDDFRNFFKTSKEEKETSFEELIQSVFTLIGTSYQTKNIKFVIDIKNERKFKTHFNELQQVLLNLIKNAEEILMENQIENPTIIITAQDNIIEICDNGGGVPEAIIDQIFEPYFSTKEKKNGTGLGLYMSKIIIEEHCKGTLTVYNNDIGGACFVVEL